MRPWPWPCYVLGIDAAARSGWAAVSRGEPVLAGEGELTLRLVIDVVEGAIDAARREGLPIVAAIESHAPASRWSGRKGSGHRGTSEAAGPWRIHLRQTIGARRVLRINVATWHSRIIGGKPGRKEVTQNRLMALYPRLGPLGPDAADALGVALCASTHDMTARALPVLATREALVDDPAALARFDALVRKKVRT